MVLTYLYRRSFVWLKDTLWPRKKPGALEARKAAAPFIAASNTLCISGIKMEREQFKKIETNGIIRYSKQ